METETNRDPYLLQKDRKISAPLIEGTAERNEVYHEVESGIELLLAKALGQIENGLRSIRAQDIGEEAAAAEARIGSKPEEQWAQEAEARRVARREQYEQEMLKAAEEKKRQRAAEEKRREDERDKAEQDKRRRRREEEAEREREKARERKRQEEHELELAEHERERDERRERRRREERERERQRDNEHERERTRERERRRKSIDHSAKSIPPEQEKNLEEIALMELLKEGQAAAKSRQRPELERSEDIEPPTRKMLAPKSIVPRDPVAARLAKLEKSPVKSETPDSKTEAGKPEPAKATEEIAEMPTVVKEESSKQEPGEITAKPIIIRSIESIDKRTKEDLSTSMRPSSRHEERNERTPHERIIEKSHEPSRRTSSRVDNTRESDRPSHRERSRSRESRSYRDSRDFRRDRSRERSRSPPRRRRERSRSRTPPRRRSLGRSRSPPRRRRERSRSTTPPRRSLRGRSRTPPRRHRERSRSPPDIDRYVPSTSSRSNRDVERTSSRSQRDDRGRDRDNDQDRDSRRGGDSYAREREEKHRYFDIDRMSFRFFVVLDTAHSPLRL